MGLDLPPAGRAALRRYLRGHGTSLATRAHVALRWLSCPFPAVEALLPDAGEVLEIGCGHGLCSLYVALNRPTRHVLGVDIDGGKLAEARRAAAGVTNVAFEEVPAGWHPLGEWPTVLVVDVLYLLGPGPGDDLLASAAAAVANGGRLVVKEIDTTPAWKYRLAVGQELAATRVARVTRGETVQFLTPDRMEATMAAAGLTVTRQRVDRGYPHPHLLLVGERRRPGGGEPDTPVLPGAEPPERMPVGAYASGSWP
jgi:SAM-dependent methyltransferase